MRTILATILVVLSVVSAQAQLCYNPNNWGAPPTPCGVAQHQRAPVQYERVVPRQAQPADEVPTGANARPPGYQPKRSVVSYPTEHPAGSIIVDTDARYAYFVLGNGEAIRYGIGVGRDGFDTQAAGTHIVASKQEWPDWHPPTEMLERQPYLPRRMAGGPGNPLGARALYLGKTLFRIHGTNAPNTIGTRVSSGCFRLTNENIIDLASRVQVGAKVVVLPPRPSVARR